MHSPSTRSGGWKDRRRLVEQSPSQSEAPDKVIGTPPKGKNGLLTIEGENPFSVQAVQRFASSSLVNGALRAEDTMAMA